MATSPNRSAEPYRTVSRRNLCANAGLEIIEGPNTISIAHLDRLALVDHGGVLLPQLGKVEPKFRSYPQARKPNHPFLTKNKPKKKKKRNPEDPFSPCPKKG